MDKNPSPGLFINDGSFMEKFKQLEQGSRAKAASEESKPSNSPASSVASNATVKPVTFFNKKSSKTNEAKVSGAQSSGGKLAFSLKQRLKAVAPAIKLGADDDDEEGGLDLHVAEGPSKRQKLGQLKATEPSPSQGVVVPSTPSDPAVKSVADKLASFVAKNGRQLENITRQKNPGDTPFRFLYDPCCSDYKYYEYRILEEEKLLALKKDSRGPCGVANASASSTRSSSGSQQGNSPRRQSYQTPASALYEPSERAAKGERGSVVSDPLAMMEFYMKRAAQEEQIRQPRQSKDEMPPPASLQATSKKGHHMGDYIPPEELERFMASCNDVAAQKAAREAAERNRIQADNVGHKLLSKMGWREGEGLGSSRSGRAEPVVSGGVKQNNLGVGANNPSEVTPEDDIYEQYKKRMMLGYRYRPNPLNNPRKQYY